MKRIFTINYKHMLTNEFLAPLYFLFSLFSYYQFLIKQEKMALENNLKCS